MMDGIPISIPTVDEQPAWDKWLMKNKINEPYHPAQHYDYVSAFRNGINRDKENGHFPDTYKLPNHPTFSVESMYYQPNMKAGYWRGEKYIPITSVRQLPSDILKQLLGKR